MKLYASWITTQLAAYGSLVLAVMFNSWALIGVGCVLAVAAWPLQYQAMTQDWKEWGAQ